MSTVKQSSLFTLLTRDVEIWAARESESIWSTRLEAETIQTMQPFIACTHNSKLR